MEMASDHLTFQSVALSAPDDEHPTATAAERPHSDQGQPRAQPTADNRRTVGHWTIDCVPLCVSDRGWEEERRGRRRRR